MSQPKHPISLTGAAVASLAGVLFILSGPALAQESASAPAEDAVEVQQATAAPEQIVVVGERSRRSLINEAGQETENFYSLLNDFLRNDDFEIRCRNEFPPGSNISRRVCRARYMERLESRAALSALQGIGVSDEGFSTFSGSSFDQAPQLLQMQQQFEELVIQAVNTDLDLNRSVVRLMALKDAIDNYDSSRD
jgi:hypothetical protein